MKSLPHFANREKQLTNISGSGGSEDTFKAHGAWMCILTVLFHTVKDLRMGPVHGVRFA